MRGDDLAAGRLADEREVGFHPQLGKCARAGLVAFLVHQADENDLGFTGTLFAAGHVFERAEHGCDAAFGVARATTVQLVALFCGTINLRVAAADGVEVWREDDTVPRLAKRREADDQVVAPRRDRLALNIELGLGGALGEVIGDFGFTGARVARWQESGIDAGQRDQVAQELDSLAHGRSSTVTRRGGQSSACPSQAMMSWATLPWTSVSRKSRPAYL